MIFKVRSAEFEIRNKFKKIVTNFSSAYEQIEYDFNGVMINLNDTDYTKYIDRIVKNKKVYKNNLKDFVYTNEIEE